MTPINTILFIIAFACIAALAVFQYRSEEVMRAEMRYEARTVLDEVLKGYNDVVKIAE